ncbi:hypothetical protein PoB_002936000 [Plakobranchus ocellatus]|uniref:PiggyBac transposable element-derived protein domain-containing protein n=1 Tax=Plakobranchus ocellatus TaxID=259542 RepID=A0AAV4A651_9GAST|nr:hypothetical protein PoB_002936000 [Plakobranchus ocellatus]
MRVGFPPQLKTFKLQHMGLSMYFSEDNKILCVAFKDKKAKKPCVLVTTNSAMGMEQGQSSRNRETTKPIPILEYNCKMNGCDSADQMAGYYNAFDRKSYKWWKKTFIGC